MIATKIELGIAWKARGGGYADTVTEGGWKGFEEHGKLAGKYLEEAWKMHPEWPEAAGLAVYVSCGQGGLDDMIKWFNRAISAQIDYSPAYESLLWGLRPRWYGSWHMMLAFGRKAADVDESWYYTTAPMAFVWSVQNVGDEMNFAQLRVFLREQLPNVRGVLEKRMAAVRLKKDWDNYWHLHAVLSKHLLLCGYYAEAKTVLAKSWSGDNGYDFHGRADNYFKDSRQEMEIEIALATGKSSEIIRQADAAISDGDTEKAAKLYLSLIPQNSQSPERIFLEKRVAQLFLSHSSGDRGIFALARCGSIPGVRAFLDAKYDVNIRGKNDYTLMQHSLFMDSALMHEQPETYAASKIAMLKFLMSRGADIHALAGQKLTMQHLVVSNKLPVEVLAFIASQPGVDLNVGDSNMTTPLIWCAMLDLTGHAQFLIKHGADINHRDKNGKTALDHVRSNEMRQILLDAAKPR